MILHRVCSYVSVECVLLHQAHNLDRHTYCGVQHICHNRYVHHMALELDC